MSRPDCPAWCDYDHSHDPQLPGDVINHLGTIATIPSEYPIVVKRMQSDLPTGDTLTGYLLDGTDSGAGCLDLPEDPDHLDQLADLITRVASAIRTGGELP